MSICKILKLCYSGSLLSLHYPIFGLMLKGISWRAMEHWSFLPSLFLIEICAWMFNVPNLNFDIQSLVSNPIHLPLTQLPSRWVHGSLQCLEIGGQWHKFLVYLGLYQGNPRDGGWRFSNQHRTSRLSYCVHNNILV